jgi:23S rRNA (cytidine1920-2'-O)/16S rRNA (cytidine1409-2'-O)-methyltransferase
MRRLDQELVERGIVSSRSRARAATLAGMVTVDGTTELRPGRLVSATAALAVNPAAGTRFVSRGALKLIAALDHFAVSAEGKVALDVGASTGGFSQILLERGAAHVYAVDVGSGQLAASLTADPRVTSLERLNARDLRRAHVPEPVNIIVCDVSFIGLELVLPNALALAAEAADLIALIKPQFQVGPEGVGRGGIVRDAGLHRIACERVADWVRSQDRWHARGIIDSPVLGGDGNREFLLCARRD